MVKNHYFNLNNSQQGIDGVRKHKVRNVPSHRLFPFVWNSKYMKSITTRNGIVFTVDDTDFESVNKYPWYLVTDKEYSRTKLVTYYKRKTTSIGVFLLGTKKGFVVDHKDGDQLNNQRNNLRVCTLKENNQNKKIYRNNKSGFKGVVRNAGNTWRAQITVNKKQIRVYGFRSAKEASVKYQQLAHEYFGEFARVRHCSL